MNAQTITDRENEILGLMLEGMTMKQVAENLGIAKSTVWTHVKHIHQKTGTCSTLHAVGVLSGWRPAQAKGAK